MRHLFVFALFASLSFHALPALAQDDVDLLSVEDRDELSAIETQADVATALYIGGLTVHVAGLGGAVAYGLASFCISFSGSCPVVDDGWVEPVLLGVSGLGLAVFFTAIGLDVDSGVRRRDLRERTGVDVSIAPTRDGASFLLSGRF
ncbi:hypothetical protein [Sandaracinus amylolyticus]|uniref:hypothetical protein n=1 Tax=Sandaracinus amylolyticus TaxID=927083 RepID=UPI001F179077|nr:hypothetical protein [Sandaracinus amylolyticus]UJR82038.1 Hypothetical protein I5071_41030 [Sandaracinus amylolyticus]